MMTITLDDSRELTIEPVAPHEAMGIAEGCRQLSGVRQWWRTAMTVAAVRGIDGIPMPMPTHEKHIEGMVARFSRSDLKMISEELENYAAEESLLELEMAELTPLETLRVWAFIGEFETVAGWVAPAFIATSVRKIGGERISFPSNKEEVKALVARLGHEGMARASSFMLAQAASQKASEADKRAAAKK